MPSEKYLMSFVTGGLYINESVEVARLVGQDRSWDEVAREAVKAGVFPVRKENSARRTIREITNRLRQLTTKELEYFRESDRADQVALLWLATCRAYRFVREFSLELLADRYLTRRFEINYDDFDAFYERKAEWSADLAKIAPSTRQKLRSVFFRIMREGGILSEDNRIQSVLLSSRFVRCVSEYNKSELSLFPGGEQLARGVIP